MEVLMYNGEDNHSVSVKAKIALPFNPWASNSASGKQPAPAGMR